MAIDSEPQSGSKPKTEHLGLGKDTSTQGGNVLLGKSGVAATPTHFGLGQSVDTTVKHVALGKDEAKLAAERKLPSFPLKLGTTDESSSTTR